MKYKVTLISHDLYGFIFREYWRQNVAEIRLRSLDSQFGLALVETNVPFSAFSCNFGHNKGSLAYFIYFRDRSMP